VTGAVAVDVVVLATAPNDDGSSHLVFCSRRRSQPPFAGRWALPGHVLADEEELDTAAAAVFSRYTGLHRPRHLEQLATFGDPHRDPRGRVVSVSYLALLARPSVTGDDTVWRDAVGPTAPAAPHPVIEHGLAFDHDRILAAGVERLRSKLGYSNVAFGLLPDEFTLRDLQDVYEAVLGTRLDKRNFRKKVLGLDLVVEAVGVRRGSHRPAQLYRFAHRQLVTIEATAIA
jgi:8-oxo-dGTP diphosphatase